MIQVFLLMWETSVRDRPPLKLLDSLDLTDLVLTHLSTQPPKSCLSLLPIIILLDTNLCPFTKHLPYSYSFPGEKLGNLSFEQRSPGICEMRSIWENLGRGSSGTTGSCRREAGWAMFLLPATPTAGLSFTLFIGGFYMFSSEANIFLLKTLENCGFENLLISLPFPRRQCTHNPSRILQLLDD